MNRIDEVLKDPACSYWLKTAIGNLVQRDPVDALNDAECLADLMRGRLEELHGMAS